VTRREREPLLFDLPAAGPPEAPAASPPAAGSRRRAAAGGKILPLFADPPAQPAIPSGAGEAEARIGPSRSLAGDALSPAAIAPVSLRLLAGLLDLGIFGAVTAGTALGASALLPSGSTLNWLPVLVFLLVFSLFATVLPLAFWLDGQAITFRQSFVRWLGGLLTILGAGIPLLVALSGRSLADRVSGSRTLRR
jgi:hypothetical protein